MKAANAVFNPDSLLKQKKLRRPRLFAEKKTRRSRWAPPPPSPLPLPPPSSVPGESPSSTGSSRSPSSSSPTVNPIKNRLLRRNPNGLDLNSVSEDLGIPVDQAQLVLDALASVLPSSPSDRRDPTVHELVMFLYIQSYKRLVPRSHKDSAAAVADVWPSTSAFDGYLSHAGGYLVIAKSSALIADSYADPDEAAAIHDTLSVVEDMIEVKPAVADLVCERTKLLRWLLNRIKIWEFDANKHYASEILAILLQSSSANQRRLGQMNCVDEVLQAVAMYKSRDPRSTDEEEMLENLFDCWCCLPKAPTPRRRDHAIR